MFCTMVDVARGDPPQAEHPAKQNSFLYITVPGSVPDIREVQWNCQQI